MNRMLALALVAALLTCSGCKTHSTLKRTKPDYANALATPPPFFVQEIRQQQIKERTQTLYETGKYKNIGDARKAAERDLNTNYDDTAQQRWAHQQAIAQKRKDSQARFEKELAAMDRE